MSCTGALVWPLPGKSHVIHVGVTASHQACMQARRWLLVRSIRCRFSQDHCDRSWDLFGGGDAARAQHSRMHRCASSNSGMVSGVVHTRDRCESLESPWEKRQPICKLHFLKRNSGCDLKRWALDRKRRGKGHGVCVIRCRCVCVSAWRTGSDGEHPADRTSCARPGGHHGSGSRCL